VAAAASILQHAWYVYTNPVPIETPLAGMAVSASSTGINIAWAMTLMRRGRALRSPALLADGQHLISDVVTSIGVLLGLALAVITGRQWLDPALAAMIAAYVLGSGFRLVRESVGGLMDAAPDTATVNKIRALVSQYAEGAIEAHDLRVRYAGRLIFLEFHLVVPGTMQVSEAHAICDRIETALKSEIKGLMISIHVEPEGKAKHHGVVVL
jgi:cation diffusion facilitator family transporter